MNNTVEQKQQMTYATDYKLVRKYLQLFASFLEIVEIHY